MSSIATDPKHRMDPIPFIGDPSRAFLKIRNIVTTLPNAHVVGDNDSYLHLEFRTRLFRFTDDVEFLVDNDEKVIHFRSASRVGYSDLGVNRRRMGEIVHRFLDEESEHL